jgi:hypothetical protein
VKPKTTPRRVWLLHCDLGGDLIQSRCHLDTRCTASAACNARDHFCKCKPKLYVLSRGKENDAR